MDPAKLHSNFPINCRNRFTRRQTGRVQHARLNFRRLQMRRLSRRTVCMEAMHESGRFHRVPAHGNDGEDRYYVCRSEKPSDRVHHCRHQRRRRLHRGATAQPPFQNVSSCITAACTKAAWWSGNAAAASASRLDFVATHVPEPGRDLAERRPRPILGHARRPADMNEARDLLVRLQAERVEHGAVVGVPLGEPTRA